VHTDFWWGILRERDDLKDLSIHGRVILKWIFNKWDGGMAGLMYGRVERGCKLL
jgi:hypothetical protein